MSDSCDLGFDPDCEIGRKIESVTNFMVEDKQPQRLRRILAIAVVNILG
ncbi:MAG: hypothetical protein ACRD4L_00935 [Pyrinomonadaceae bacterium]